MSRRLALALVLCSGCHCGTSPDSDSPVDSGDGPEPDLLSIDFSVPEDTVPPSEGTLALVHVSFGEGPLMGQTMASTALDLAGVSLQLPSEVPDEHVTALNGEAGYGGALYALVVFEDSDSDGAFQEGELILGLAMDRWLLWLYQSCYGCDTAEEPIEAWHVVDLGIGGQYEPNRCALDTSWPMEWMADRGYPTWHTLDVPVEIQLRGLEASASLEASIVGPERDDLWFAALPYPHLGDSEVSPWLEQALGPDQVGVEGLLAGEPPGEDDVGADPDWRYTMHLLLPFVDSDGSGGWSLGDELEGSSTCWEGELAWARYTRAVTSYRGYRFLDCYSGNVGWRPVHYADHGGIEYLSSATGRQLVLDFADCRLDG